MLHLCLNESWRLDITNAYENAKSCEGALPLFPVKPHSEWDWLSATDIRILKHSQWNGTPCPCHFHVPGLEPPFPLRSITTAVLQYFPQGSSVPLNILNQGAQCRQQSRQCIQPGWSNAWLGIVQPSNQFAPLLQTLLAKVGNNINF